MLTKFIKFDRTQIRKMYHHIASNSGTGSKLVKKTHSGSPTSVTPVFADSFFTDGICDALGRRSFAATPVEYPPFDRASVRGEFGTYASEYDNASSNPESFWGEAAKSIHWFQPPTKILSQDPDKPYKYQWFADGTTNTTYNCLDVHVNQGNGDRTALIYDSPVTGTKDSFSYQQLLDKVSVFAGALKHELGVEPGDRVVIYMPMIPEAIVAMVSYLVLVQLLLFPPFFHPLSYFVAGMYQDWCSSFSSVWRVCLA